MFSGTGRFRNIPSPTYKKAIHWHKIVPILLLALYVCGAGSSSLVATAPAADETIDHFTISTSDIITPACAYSSYEVQFFANVDRTANLNGTEVDLDGGDYFSYGWCYNGSNLPKPQSRIKKHNSRINL